MFPHHKGAKRDTIGVTKGTSAKLPHYPSLRLAYPMENEMPLIYHLAERWGCSYANEDGKSLSERT